MDRLGGNRRMAFALIGALLVNAVLLALLPASVSRKGAKPDLEDIMAVNMVEIKRQPRPQPPEEKPKEEPPKEIPKVLPNVPMQSQTPQVARMELPPFSFDINPKLSGGVAVTAPPATTSGQMPRDLYRQSEVEHPPVAVVQLKPNYPPKARRHRLEGKVDVQFVVNTDGSVSQFKILSSDHNGIFDDSVKNTLLAWKFTPGKIKGQPVRTLVVTSIEFKLEG